MNITGMQGLAHTQKAMFKTLAPSTRRINRNHRGSSRCGDYVSGSSKLIHITIQSREDPACPWIKMVL